MYEEPRPHYIDMKTITCREVGFDCDTITEGETENEVMQRGIEHAMEVHGLKEDECTPEVKEKIRGLVRNS